MSRKLDDLSPAFRPLAMELIARCAEQGCPVMVIDTLRTPEEQAEKLAAGLSWTEHSKHLTGDAIDVAPLSSYQLRGPSKPDWNSADPVWSDVGAIGERLGLRWGGRWKHADLGHFELVAVAVDPTPENSAPIGEPPAENGEPVST